MKRLAASQARSGAGKVTPKMLSKLEHSQQDLEQANKKIVELEDELKKVKK